MSNIEDNQGGDRQEFFLEGAAQARTDGYSQEELAAMASAGNLEAFEQLMIINERKVFTMLVRILGNENDAKDLTQETFLRAFANIRRFRRQSSFTTYLFQIAKNLSFNFIRGQKVEKIYNESASPAPGPEEIVLRKETQMDVQNALRKLPADDRTLIILRDIQELSYMEMAEVMNCPEGTIKSRLSRARSKLKEILFREE